MGIFSRKKGAKIPVYGAVDGGGDAIRALKFQTPAGDTTPRAPEKFVWEAPVSYSAMRLARKVKKTVPLLAHGTHPQRILIGVGPEGGECAIENWRDAPPPGGGAFTRSDMRLLYRALLKKHHDPRRFTIAFPVALWINGYPFAWPAEGGRDADPPRGDIKEIMLRVLTVAMSPEAGDTFIQIQKELGGITVDVLPIAASLQEAVLRGLGMEDALVIDVRGHATAILVIRGGVFAHAAYVPFGLDRFVRGLSASAGVPATEARQMIRQRILGMSTARTGEGVAGTMKREAAEWKKLLIRRIEAAVAAGPLPQQILLSGPGAMLPEVRAALQSGDWFSMFSHAEQPLVRILDGSAFFGGDTLGGVLGSPEDTGLASLAWYMMNHKPLF